MSNLEKNKEINYWNPEWINESFNDEYLDDTFYTYTNDNYTDQRYLLLSPLATQQKNITIQNINNISIKSTLSG